MLFKERDGYKARVTSDRIQRWWVGKVKRKNWRDWGVGEGKSRREMGRQRDGGTNQKRKSLADRFKPHQVTKLAPVGPNPDTSE